MMTTSPLAVTDLTEEQRAAIEMLGEGIPATQTAKALGIAASTVQTWKRKPGFRMELDRRTLQLGMSRKAERIRFAQQAIEQARDKDTGMINTQKDPLEWLKYIAHETGQWFSNSEVAQQERKLKIYETLMYLLRYEACDVCKTLVARRMMELGDDEEMETRNDAT